MPFLMTIRPVQATGELKMIALIWNCDNSPCHHDTATVFAKLDKILSEDKSLSPSNLIKESIACDGSTARILFCNKESFMFAISVSGQNMYDEIMKYYQTKCRRILKVKKGSVDLEVEAMLEVGIRHNLACPHCVKLYRQGQIVFEEIKAKNYECKV